MLSAVPKSSESSRSETFSLLGNKNQGTCPRFLWIAQQSCFMRAAARRTNIKEGQSPSFPIYRK